MLSRPDSRLMCCSRCTTAWYCSKDCQKAHYKDKHKDVCLAVAGYQQSVEREAIPIRQTRIYMDDKQYIVENLFETRVGLFGQLDATANYMDARIGLIEMYLKAAFRVEIKNVWEKVLFHALEMQKLDANLPCFSFLEPTLFVLLILHRDDDACDYIHYWMKEKVNKEGDTNKHMLRCSQSKEGDWMYPHEKDCRYHDFIQKYPKLSDENDVPLAFLLAALIVKLRLVATYDATRRSIDSGSHTTTGGKSIQEVQMEVREKLIDEKLMNIESQREQVDQIITLIQRINPTLLPATLNPDLLFAIVKGTRARGEPTEAKSLILYSIRCLARIPGAREKLEQRFGRNPSYPV
ncbi:hypothetical protein FisN_12Lu377 [Fistulifera solaris]|uniref:MYND-type domain-containing protein n=1 Tax=Fistulifera solaris TaxID=1519565 RepID=A0A1Z5JMM3_FISSO|nr:hypothetical protein FisN_12Lu377 [Fistulifera solaris]|eukprot:GAX15112.1 hypothetical protein FisN_12Lu377 [Fistulifera solaris]